jgi:hypothetical protein
MRRAAYSSFIGGTSWKFMDVRYGFSLRGYGIYSLLCPIGAKAQNRPVDGFSVHFDLCVVAGKFLLISAKTGLLFLAKY